MIQIRVIAPGFDKTYPVVEGTLRQAFIDSLRATEGIGLQYTALVNSQLVGIGAGQLNPNSALLQGDIVSFVTKVTHG